MILDELYQSILFEGVKMAPSVFSVVQGDENFQVGFEVEFFPVGDEFEGVDLEALSLDNARNLDNWNEELFSESYFDYIDQFGQISEETYWEKNKNSLAARLDLMNNSELGLGQLEKVKELMVSELKLPESEIEVNSAYGLPKDYTKWNVEPDSEAVEINSPIQTLQDSLTWLPQILNFISRHGKTSGANGLHVHMSYKGKGPDDIDTLKLGLFLGENYILDMFDRLANKNTKPQMFELISSLVAKLPSSGSINPTGDDKQDALTITPSQVSSLIKSNEYRKFESYFRDNIFYVFDKSGVGTRNRSFNTRYLALRGSIEFRMAGNEGYERRAAELRTLFLRYAYVMKLAMDPTSFLKEYAKKLTKLFNIIFGMRANIDQATTSKFIAKKMDPKVQGLIKLLGSIGFSNLTATIEGTKVALTEDYITALMQALKEQRNGLGQAIANGVSTLAYIGASGINPTKIKLAIKLLMSIGNVNSQLMVKWIQTKGKINKFSQETIDSALAYFNG